MENSKHIKHIELREDVLKGFQVLQELRTDLTEDGFVELYEKMHKEGYRLISLEVDDKCVAIAGVNILTNFYNNRFLFVYDLVTKSTERSKGYGEELLTYIHEYAKEQECAYVTLESGFQRVDAHRFYENKMNYDKFCYSFRYKL